MNESIYVDEKKVDFRNNCVYRNINERVSLQYESSQIVKVTITRLKTAKLAIDTASILIGPTLPQL